MGKKARKEAAAAASSAPASASAKVDLELPAENAPEPTGAITQHMKPDFRTGRDVILEKFDLTFKGKEILRDTKLELLYGHRYGLVGPNGCGKSTLLKVIGRREIPLPPGMDIFLLEHEAPASDMSALEAVLSVDSEKSRIERQIEKLEAAIGDGADDELTDRLSELYDRLDELSLESAEARAASILSGLGLDHAMQQSPVRSFSGGWRMRIALAQALYMSPMLLVLDEPTNHLDIEAVVWLETFLARFQKILLIVSHSADFMNTVCTNIIHMHAVEKQLRYYSGNYDMYVTLRSQSEEHQSKRHAAEQEEIKKMKDYIARFGHGSAKLARQAQSKEKTLAKMQRGGLTEAVKKERPPTFFFPDPPRLPPPVLSFTNVSFRYPKKKKEVTDFDGAAAAGEDAAADPSGPPALAPCPTSPVAMSPVQTHGEVAGDGENPLLYEKLDFGLDLDSRVVLVGPNGAGKTTLQKLMTGELAPTDGHVSRHCHLTMGRYAQHFVDQLDMTLSPLHYLLKLFPGDASQLELLRRFLGRFGLSGEDQTRPMYELSDGQKSRVVFAMLAYRGPHIILLDEPTNHLDMESIDALSDALVAFEGGVVLVSHDMRLIEAVATEIWIVDDRTITPFRGTIADYKASIMKKLEETTAARAAAVSRVVAMK